MITTSGWGQSTNVRKASEKRTALPDNPPTLTTWLPRAAEQSGRPVTANPLAGQSPDLGSVRLASRSPLTFLFVGFDDSEIAVSWECDAAPPVGGGKTAGVESAVW